MLWMNLIKSSSSLKQQKCPQPLKFNVSAISANNIKEESGAITGITTYITFIADHCNIKYLLPVVCGFRRQSREKEEKPGVTWKERAWDLVSGSADFSAWLDYISWCWVRDCQRPARSQDRRPPTPTTYPRGWYCGVWTMRKIPSQPLSVPVRGRPRKLVDTQGFAKE